MITYITSAVLLGISIVGFLTFTNPIYTEIKDLKMKAASYNEALDNSKALENERDKLVAKYNTISGENLEKIKKLLPDGIDNIRLILEIEQLAIPYGMVLKDVKYNAVKKDAGTPEAGAIQGGAGLPDQFFNKDYGSWDLEFTTTGIYNNFIRFTKDLENNLRIVDISAIQFSAGPDVKVNPELPEVYDFHFKIKTYWLKN